MKRMGRSGGVRLRCDEKERDMRYIDDMQNTPAGDAPAGESLRAGMTQ